MMYLLDTDHMTAIERGGSTGQKLTARLRAATFDSIATTIVSYEEQTRGWLSTMAQRARLTYKFKFIIG